MRAYDCMKNLSIMVIIFFACVLGISSQSVCIDPGHGGSDPGAVGNGLKESHINLDVGNRFHSILANAGYRVYMTRTSDATVSLSSRTQYANNLGVDRFISIHCNAASSTSANGTETFCYPGVGGVTVRLRDKTNPEVVAAMNTYNRGCKTADFHVLRETNMPAILVEIAFISNAGDAGKLGDAYYRQRAAEALKRGLVNAGLMLEVVLGEEVESKDYYMAPRFTADGNLLVQKAGDPQTYSVPLAGGILTQLAIHPMTCVEDILVFSEENEIFVTCNGQTKQITHGQDIFFCPVLSPDKKWVAYQGMATGISIASLENETVLSIGQGNYVSWTPDSQSIVFEVSSDNGQEITSSTLQVVQLATPDMRSMIPTGIKARRPSVSPDGSKVAFDSDGKIFVADLQTRGKNCVEVLISK